MAVYISVCWHISHGKNHKNYGEKNIIKLYNCINASTGRLKFYLQTLGGKYIHEWLHISVFWHISQGKNYVKNPITKLCNCKHQDISIVSWIYKLYPFQ